MNQKNLKQLHAALTHLLEEEGRGAQTRLSTEQKIDRGYLNAIVKQRKSGSGKMWGKISHHFNMTLEEMLSLGRTIFAEVEAPGLDQGKREEPGVSQGVTIAPADKIKKYDFSPKPEKTIPDIPEKIVQAIEILRGDTGYSSFFSDVVDVFRKTINTEEENALLKKENALVKKENALLKDKLKEFESRLDLLECQSENENFGKQQIA
jgi:hypothetical protein